MNKSMTRALFALVVTLCAAMAAAQEMKPGIPEAAVTAAQRQQSAPLRGDPVDNFDDDRQDNPPQGAKGASDEIQQKLDRIRELEQKSAQANEALERAATQNQRYKANSDLALLKSEASHLRQDLAALRRRQTATEGRVNNLETSDKGQNKRLDIIVDTVFGAKGKDDKRSGGALAEIEALKEGSRTTNQKIDDLDEKLSKKIVKVETSSNEVRDYLDGDDNVLDNGDDPLAFLAKGIKSVTASIGGLTGWVWFFGIIAVLALLLSGFNFLAGSRSSPASAVITPAPAPAPTLVPPVRVPVTPITPPAAPAPTIDNVNPRGAAMAGGIPLMITGSNFVGSTVIFRKRGQADLSATAILVDPAGDQITCQTPIFTVAGIWNLVVCNADGQKTRTRFNVVL